MGTINKPYKEVSILHKKSKFRHKKQIFIVFLLFFIIFLIFFSIFKIINKYTTHKIEQVEYFSVYTKLSAENNENAEKLASKYKARGGAGVVLKIDNDYIAVLATFPTQKDANVVLGNLAKQNITCYLLNTKTPIIKISKLNAQNQNITKNIYSKYIETINLLYDIAIKFDKNTITESEAITKINQITLLWNNRLNELTQKIDIVSISSKEIKKHELYPIYKLTLNIAGQLQYLSTENAYQTNLQTFVSIIRQVNYTLITIEI